MGVTPGWPAQKKRPRGLGGPRGRFLLLRLRLRVSPTLSHRPGLGSRPRSDWRRCVAVWVSCTHSTTQPTSPTGRAAPRTDRLVALDALDFRARSPRIQDGYADPSSRTTSRIVANDSRLSR